jgi:hypothetical protein
VVAHAIPPRGPNWTYLRASRKEQPPAATPDGPARPTSPGGSPALTGCAPLF